MNIIGRLGRTTSIAPVLLSVACGAPANRPASEPRVSTLPISSSPSSDAVSPNADGNASSAQADEPSTGASPVQIQLAFEPSANLTADQANELTVRFEITNRGASSAELDMKSAVLLVDGRPLKQWEDAWDEISREQNWRPIPPSETVRFRFRFAKKVRIKSGEYRFQLRIGALSSAVATLHVSP